MADPYAYADAPLRPDDTADNAGGWASVIERLAGHARRLYEELTGAGIDDGPVAAPRNAQGLYGRDYSGPPHGPAILHPLCIIAGADPDAAHLDVGDGAYLEVGSTVSATVPLRYRVRGHHQHREAPYTRGYVYLRAARTTAGSSDLTVQAVGPLETRSTTITVSSTSATGFDLDDDGSADAFWVEQTPGLNQHTLTLTVDTGAVRVYALALYQRARLRHS